MRASRYVYPLLLATSAMATLPAAAFAQAQGQTQAGCGPSVTTAAVVPSAPIPPPALPVYEQPPIPAPGYIWTPGYWSYASAGYYWVPGTWVLPPTAGLLWTPGYWGWSNGVYAFNAGFWGLTVGFYGGINYGFGYNGHGYWGGRWDNGHFAYNRAVNNFGGVHITNVYNRTVINNDDFTPHQLQWRCRGPNRAADRGAGSLRPRAPLGANPGAGRPGRCRAQRSILAGDRKSWPSADRRYRPTRRTARRRCRGGARGDASQRCGRARAGGGRRSQRRTRPDRGDRGPPGRHPRQRAGSCGSGTDWRGDTQRGARNGTSGGGASGGAYRSPTGGGASGGAYRSPTGGGPSGGACGSPAGRGSPGRA